MSTFHRLLIMLTLVICTLISCTMPAAEVAAEKSSELISEEVLPENVKVGYLGNQKIYYEVVDGKNIYQGDITLKDEQISEQPTRGLMGTIRTWPNGDVPVIVVGSQEMEKKINQAIQHWRDKTGINIHEPYLYYDNYIIIGSRGMYKSSSNLGMVGGDQEIDIARYASVGEIIHLIGHALGLGHEHNRMDRDNHIRINWSNIMPGMESYFALNQLPDGDVAQFDFNSIMLKPSQIIDYELARDVTIPLITKVDGSTYDVQREGLSTGDILTANALYPKGHRVSTAKHSYFESAMDYDQGVKLIPLDYNGDGLTDFIRQESGILEEHTGFTNDYFILYIADVNGDFTPTRFTGLQYQRDLRGDMGCNIIPGDFNGDGRDDFIRQEKGGFDDDENGTFGIYFANSTGGFDIVYPADDGYDYQRWLKGDDGCNIIPGDFDGDNKTDFIRQETNGWGSNSHGNFSVHFSRGDGTFRKVQIDTAAYQEELKADPGCNIIPGDFNGDGKADFIRQERGVWTTDSRIPTFSIYISNGDGSFTKLEPPTDEIYQILLNGDLCNIIPADFNNDGKTDFIRQRIRDNPISRNDKVFTYYYSQGDGTFTTETPAGDIHQHMLKSYAGCNIIPGNFDSDGKTDFIRQEKGRWSGDHRYTFQVYHKM